MTEPNKWKQRKIIFIKTALAFFLLFIHDPILAQSPDSLHHNEINKKRFHTFVISSSVAYGATLGGLYHLWYKNTEQQSFKFFNDNAEWKQVDKIGHFYSSFYLSYTAHQALRWSGVSQKKSNLIASLTGFMILVPIEIFDGFSNAYGASPGDLAADAGGAALFYGQQVLWNQIRIHPKYSFHSTRYSALRPDVLGNNSVSKIFKDYNGQTYWLSFDVDKFITFPKWLNFAIGYGAENMVYARDAQNMMLGYDSYRQYYISLDFDLTSIKTKSKTIKTLIYIANMIKLPAPTLSFSRKGNGLKPFYF